MGVTLGNMYGSEIRTSHVEREGFGDRYKISASEFRDHGNSATANKLLDKEEARRLRDDLNEFLG